VNNRPHLPVLDDSVLAQMLGPDVEVQAEVVADYLEEAPAILSELAAACRAVELKRAQQLAHRLKSASRWVGGMALGELCETLEHLKPPVSEAEIAIHLTSIELAYQSLVKALEQSGINSMMLRSETP
jgi:HPt (histidine-containing phosphotransfer) domain-containing protein